MIEVNELTKRYGRRLAIDELSFKVTPGSVTGFLGPNGAGKSTTMRVILGLSAATSGSAFIDGQRYVSLRRPMHRVGAFLDANAVHEGRSAFDHLHCLASTNGIGRRRVAAVLEQVGLAGVATQKVGQFSLGMKQRLGIALALLGDPGVFLLDEPINGLDPEGIRWMRGLLRSFAAEGRTILISSHLMSEMAIIADRLVIIGSGRLIADATLHELAARFQCGVFVRSPEVLKLRRALEAGGGTVVSDSSGGVSVTGMSLAEIGELAARVGTTIHEMTPRRASLEDVYIELTKGNTEFRTQADIR